MIQMYSERLGAGAQKIANKCLFKLSQPKERKLPKFTFGENIFKIQFITGIPEKNWQNSIENWFSELIDLGGKSAVT